MSSPDNEFVPPPPIPFSDGPNETLPPSIMNEFPSGPPPPIPFFSDSFSDSDITPSTVNDVNTPPPIMSRPPPPFVMVEESRERGRSLSRSPPPPIQDLRCCYDPISGTPFSTSRSPSRSISRSRSRSFSPIYPLADMHVPYYWRKSRTPSPIRHGGLGQPSYNSPIIMHPPPPPPLAPLPPPPMPCMSPPLFPPPVMWPPSVVKCPVDILTFHYNKNMAYAPAAKTYDEAIDIIQDLWPELRDVDRDRIKLLVTGSEHLVRVPKIAWQAVLCDLPRYEVVHVQVDQPSPPPQYQAKDTAAWGGAILSR
ncbi:hypothetical protein BGW80DRAFT_1454588 [Lactifluus volemus]|nr:hypothetical protein BGW80DRAFT_1454588 [Lactifluus volemus]